MLAAGDRTVMVLDRREASIARGGAPLRILGATLWTDYAVTGDPAAAMTAAEREIHDHRLIRRSESSGPFSPIDALAEHRLSRTWLLRKLTEPVAAAGGHEFADGTGACRPAVYRPRDALRHFRATLARQAQALRPGLRVLLTTGYARAATGPKPTNSW